MSFIIVLFKQNQLLANCKIEVNRKDMFYSFPKGFILEAGSTVIVSFKCLLIVNVTFLF